MFLSGRGRGTASDVNLIHNRFVSRVLCVVCRVSCLVSSRGGAGGTLESNNVTISRFLLLPLAAAANQVHKISYVCT